MARWQRRHYETVAAGLRAKGASSEEIDQWIRKFAADNPRFRADFFRAAAAGGSVTVLGPRRRSGTRREIVKPTYTPRSRELTERERRSLKRHGFSGYRRRCRYGKKRVHGRWVCRRSKRR